MGPQRWQLKESDLTDLTPEKARDVLIECFYHAQRDTFARAKKKLGASGLDEAALRADIVRAIRLVFEEIGGDYARPTAATLEAVVVRLVRKAESWGTPADIIEHHARQVRSMLDLLGRRGS